MLERNFNKAWYGYVVLCADKSLYCGITTDVKRRVKDHNQTKRGSKYCRSRRPVELVGYNVFETKSAALKWEHYFKSLPRDDKIIIVRYHLDYYKGQFY